MLAYGLDHLLLMLKDGFIDKLAEMEKGCV